MQGDDRLIGRAFGSGYPSTFLPLQVVGSFDPRDEVTKDAFVSFPHVVIYNS